MARTARSGGAREAIVGANARIRGRITGEGDLVIDGTVEGDVAVRGALTIGATGRAASNVDAEAVTIDGQLEGDVVARGIVRIGPSARVRGDMHGEAISIEEGAEFVGRLDAEFDLPPELAGGTSGKRR